MPLSRSYLDACIYQYRLTHAEKKIDNDPPKLHTVLRSCIQDAIRMDEIMNENKKLLMRLSHIFRTSGYVDSTPPRSHYSSNYCERLHRASGIEKSNIDLMCVIAAAVPVVPTVKECGKFWKKQLTEVFYKKNNPFLFATGERAWLPLPSLCDQSRAEQCAPRQGVFMEFTSSTGRYMGRIEFELFTDKAPDTCKNFMTYINGSAPGVSSYLRTGFYRILPGYYIKGGDIVNGNGSGETSIYGGSFPVEKNDLCHIEPGLLCTPDDNPENCDSKFMITCKPLPSIDSKSVVFGRIILGWEVLNAINACGSAPSGKVITQVFVTGCGKISSQTKKKKKGKKYSERQSESL